MCLGLGLGISCYADDVRAKSSEKLGFLCCMYDLGVFPFRIELVGAWVDHPFISGVLPGSVVTINVVNNFKSKSGLAASSRDVAKKLWSTGIPLVNLEENAKLLFDAENTPEKEYISGSEDHIGIIYPGITRTQYNGSYWPEEIESTQDPALVAWLESVIKLVPISSRKENFNPRAIENLDRSLIRLLCESGELCWESIHKKDLFGFGEAINNSFEGKTKILPLTLTEEVETTRNIHLSSSYGVGISGAGGGGYLTVITEAEIENAIRPKIRILYHE